MVELRFIICYGTGVTGQNTPPAQTMSGVKVT